MEQQPRSVCSEPSRPICSTGFSNACPTCLDLPPRGPNSQATSGHTPPDSGRNDDHSSCRDTSQINFREVVVTPANLIGRFADWRPDVEVGGLKNPVFCICSESG